MKIRKQASDSSVLKELGARLASQRLARNLTQAELAAEAGVAKRTVERMEAGEVSARLSGLVRIFRALGLMDRLDTLLPEAKPTPIEELRFAGRKRQRASQAKRAAESKPWTWNDTSGDKP